MIKYLSLIYFAFIVSCSGGVTNSTFKVNKITPENDAIINIDQIFNISFSNDVDRNTLSNIKLTSNSLNLPINCHLTTSNNAECVAKSLLSYGQSYNLNVDETIKNVAGNTILPMRFRYSTKTVPTINSIIPAEGEVSPKNTKFTVKFSEQMLLNTLNTNQTPDNVTLFLDDTIKIPVNCISEDGITMICSIKDNLIKDKHYFLRLSSKILNKTGSSFPAQSFHYTVTKYTPFEINKIIPESGSIQESQLQYDFLFNTEIEEATVANHVTFIDEITGINVPIICTVHTLHMLCQLLTVKSLDVSHTYSLSIFDIYNTDGIAIVPITLKYIVNK